MMQRTYLFLMSALLAACSIASDPVQTEAADLKAGVVLACGSEDFDWQARRKLAFAGDLGAIECFIALENESAFIHRVQLPGHRDLNAENTNLSYGVAWRYLKWILTEDQPDGIFELAALSPRHHLEESLHHVYYGYMRQIDSGYTPLEHNQCFVRPPKMDALWKAGIPDMQTEDCLHATVEHMAH